MLPCDTCVGIRVLRIPLDCGKAKPDHRGREGREGGRVGGRKGAKGGWKKGEGKAVADTVSLFLGA